MRRLFFFIACLILALAIGYCAARFSPQYLFVGIIVLIIFFLSFQNAEFGLLVLIFSMLLSPEFVVGATQGSSLGRGVTIRFDDFILVVIGFSWFARNAVEKEIGLIAKSPLNLPIFFYVLVCLVATGWGIIAGRVEPKTGFFYVLKYLEYFIVFFMVINNIKTAEQLNRLVFCLFLTCFIVSVIGVLQIPGGERVSAPFEGESGEPNTFGGYLVFMLAIAVGLILHSRRRDIKQLLLLLLLPLLPSLLFTQSRASYLAVIPVLIVLSLFSRKRFIVLGMLGVGLAVSPLFLPATVTDRVLYTFTQRQQPGQIEIGNLRLDTSTSARLVNWRETLSDWTKHPVLGYGVSGYHFVDAQFPRVLVETGILGMISFLWLLYSVFKMAVNRLKQADTPFYRGLCVGYIAGSAGLLFHALGANTFIIVRIMEPFWFFTGLVFVAGEFERRQSLESRTSWPEDPVPPRAGVIRPWLDS
ncbi:MAG: O-antigen ligase family protein [Desulfosudaceae bacterium]